VTDGLDALIRRLGADLRPVRRLQPPALRAALWICVVLALDAVLSALGRYEPLLPATGAPRALLWSVFLAATSTSALAALAAFQLGDPTASPAWRVLPLPALVAWICLAVFGGSAPHGSDELWGTSWIQCAQCLGFIVGVFVPLAALAVRMMRRSFPIEPVSAMALAGLASASGATSVLAFVHPHAGTPLDLCVHGGAVALLVLSSALFGRRLLSERNFFARSR
jgi:hypothetical protein